MGGDGGVIASDRRFMRGAGSADHTGDSTRASAAEIAEAEKESQIQTMRTCAISGSRLDYKDVVVCPLGKLYEREAAVQALLKRIESKESANLGDNQTSPTDLGWQVRGLKDLRPARFRLIKKVIKNEELNIPICPITGAELNGLQPAYLVVKTKKKNKKDKSSNNEDEGPNVLSDKAIKEMGVEALQDEYGPFEKNDLIRIAPPTKIMDDIKSKIKEKREVEKALKSSKKKKRKKDTGSNSERTKQILPESIPKKMKAVPVVKEAKTVNDVRSNVAVAVAKSTVLSCLFSNGDSDLTEKEKKDKLFSSNC